VEWYDKIEVHIKLSKQKNSKLVATYEADNQEGCNKDMPEKWLKTLLCMVYSVNNM